MHIQTKALLTCSLTNVNMLKYGCDGSYHLLKISDKLFLTKFESLKYFCWDVFICNFLVQCSIRFGVWFRTDHMDEAPGLRVSLPYAGSSWSFLMVNNLMAKPSNRKEPV